MDDLGVLVMHSFLCKSWIHRIMRAVNALKDLKYYQQALTHISHSQDSNNERLEFLGDAVLQLVVSEEIYKRFPEFDEGEMSLARANIVNGANLAEVFHHLNLSGEVLLSKGTANLPEERKLSIYAGVMEALVGAKYLEDGFQGATELIQEIFKFDELDWSLLVQKDIKTQLQEYLQKEGIEFPTFHYEHNTHNGNHQVSATFMNQKFRGIAKLKKMAEQDLCSQLLQEALHDKN